MVVRVMEGSNVAVAVGVPAECVDVPAAGLSDIVADSVHERDKDCAIEGVPSLPLRLMLSRGDLVFVRRTVALTSLAGRRLEDIVLVDVKSSVRDDDGYPSESDCDGEFVSVLLCGAVADGDWDNCDGETAKVSEVVRVVVGVGFEADGSFDKVGECETLFSLENDEDVEADRETVRDTDLLRWPSEADFDSDAVHRERLGRGVGVSVGRECEEVQLALSSEDIVALVTVLLIDGVRDVVESLVGDTDKDVVADLNVNDGSLVGVPDHENDESRVVDFDTENDSLSLIEAFERECSLEEVLDVVGDDDDV